MRLLVLNANSTQAITDIVAGEAERAARPGTGIVAVTTTAGPAFIKSREDNAAAATAALEEARRHNGYDAVLIAASSDPGLAALRKALPVPVIGMTEASAHTACLLGATFGMIVFGGPNVPIYRELIEGYGLGSRLSGIEMLEMPPLANLLDSSPLDPLVLGAAERLVSNHGAEIVLLPSAALSPMARRLQPRLGVPILDGIACGVSLCEALVSRLPPGRTAR